MQAFGDMIMFMKNPTKFGWIIGIICLILTGCGKESGGDVMRINDGSDVLSGLGVPKFEVASDDLHGGVWDTVITNTSYGENVSPALSWDPVDGADSYAIYMIDPTARNWMHWKSNGVTDTDLDQGWAPDDEYVGPYPPSGTHDYVVYVIALKEGLSSIGGTFDSANADFETIAKELDGAGGNILAYGVVSGTYMHGDR